MRIIILFAVLFLITGNTVFCKEGEKASKKIVMLAFEKTRFKSELIEEMKKQLVDSGVKVFVKEHSDRGLDAKAFAFDAVFITNSGVRSQVRPWIVKWLEKNQKYKDRIVLHTTQTKDWKVVADVDIVTSASSRGDVKELATKYVGILKKILKK